MSVLKTAINEPDCIVLLVGGDPVLQTRLLDWLAISPPACLLVLWPDELLDVTSLAQQIALEYGFACYRRGFYQHPDHTLGLAWHSYNPRNTIPLPECERSISVLLVPAAVSHNGSDWDIDLNHSQIEVLTHLQQQGLVLAESHLQAALEHVPDPNALCPSLSQAVAAAETCAREWLAIPNTQVEMAWQSEAGRCYRWLRDLQLWQYAWTEQPRVLLTQAITQLRLQPDHIGSHLVLWLYKRYYPTGEALLDMVWREQAQHCRRIYGRHLEILPAVTDFKVTVLIPTCNRVALLKKAVGSVLAQSYADWVLWLGDDASSDGTAAYLEDLIVQDPRIQCFHQPTNQGVFATCQQLLVRVDSELVLLLADDDFLMPQALHHLVACFQQYPSIGAAHGGYYYLRWNETLKNLDIKPYAPLGENTYIANTPLELERNHYFNTAFGAGTLCRRDLLERLSQEPYTYWDWWLTIWNLGHCEVGVVPAMVAVYVDRPGLGQGTYCKFAEWGQRWLDFLQELNQALKGFCVPMAYPQKALRYLLEKVIDPYMQLGLAELPLAEKEQVQANYQALVTQLLQDSSLFVVGQAQPSEAVDIHVLMHDPVWRQEIQGLLPHLMG